MRKLIYVIAILWVAAFVWQTIAHAKPPFPFDHNGSLIELWPESTNGG
jgi:hypothetical protein